MAFRTVVRKFVRRTTSGDGESGVTVTAYRHAGDTAMGTADTAGSGDEAGLATITLEDYEPHYLSATVGGTTLQSSSRDVGFIGTVSGYDLDLFGLLHTDGVVKGRDNELAVTAAGSDMNVDIDTGAFVALGHPARNTASAEVTIGANSSGNPRIDRIVVRFVPKGQTTEGDFSFAVLEGTPAGSPTAPSVTQSSVVWEVSLAQVAVANGAATIAQGNLTDERPFCFPRYPADPGADRVLFWDDSAGTWTWLTLGTGLSISGTTLSLDDELVDIAGLTPTDNGVVIGDGNAFVVESGATLRTSVGLGTGDSPQFTAVNVGHASDTTVTRTGAGDIAVEGNAVYRAGGTDVPLTDGGTGASSAADARTNLGLVAGGAGDIWAEKAGDTMTGPLLITADHGGALTVEQVDGDNVFSVKTTATPEVQLWAADLIVATDTAFADESFKVTASTGATRITGDTASQFLVQKNNGDDVFNVNTTSPTVDFPNGTDLKGWSDAYSTEKWSIDGATGNVQTDGTLDVGGALTVSGATLLDAATTVNSDSASAFVVEQGDGTNVFQIDASNLIARISALIYIPDQSAPGVPSNGGHLWVQSGALKYRGSSGTITTIAPA